MSNFKVVMDAVWKFFQNRSMCQTCSCYIQMLSGTITVCETCSIYDTKPNWELSNDALIILVDAIMTALKRSKNGMTPYLVEYGGTFEGCYYIYAKTEDGALSKITKEVDPYDINVYNVTHKTVVEVTDTEADENE